MACLYKNLPSTDVATYAGFRESLTYVRYFLFLLKIILFSVWILQMNTQKPAFYFFFFLSIYWSVLVIDFQKIFFGK